MRILKLVYDSGSQTQWISREYVKDIDPWPHTLGSECQFCVFQFLFLVDSFSNPAISLFTVPC